jgi:hypothetical protein
VTPDPKLSTPPAARTDDVSAFVDMLAAQLRPALLDMVRPLLADQTCPCPATPADDTQEDSK